LRAGFQELSKIARDPGQMLYTIQTGEIGKSAIEPCEMRGLANF
jgi:hypothetical protein